MDDKPIGSVNMIPFIDIMLVLLTIVLTTSTFIASGKISVHLPQASDRISDFEKQKAIEIDANGGIFLEGKAVSTEALRTEVAPLPKETPFILRADKDVRLQRFITVADVLKQAGFAKVAVKTESGGGEMIGAAPVEVEDWDSDSDLQFPKPPEFKLGYGLLVSVALHAAILGTGLLLHHSSAKARGKDRLVVELFGMISNRQVEEKRVAPQVVKPPPRPRTPEVVKPEKKLALSQVESPVKQLVEPKPVAQVAPQDVPKPLPNADEAQKQQTISHENQQLDAIRKYSALLKKCIKAKLVYPKDAKRAGLTGAPTIAFRLRSDGSIEPGSLVVVRSCGHGVLDEQALQAARAASPFPVPPKPMPVALQIGFSEDRK